MKKFYFLRLKSTIIKLAFTLLLFFLSFNIFSQTITISNLKYYTSNGPGASIPSNGTIVIPAGSSVDLICSVTTDFPATPVGPLALYCSRASDGQETLLGLISGASSGTTTYDNQTVTVQSSFVSNQNGTFYAKFTSNNTDNATTYSNSYPIQTTIYNNGICCNQTFIRTGDPNSFSESSGAPKGGNGTYTYQWQSSLDNSTWTNISATSNVYDPGIINQTTYFRRLVNSGSVPQSISNVITITINPVEISTGTITPLAYCTGATVNVPFTVNANTAAGNTFTAQLSNSSGTFGSPVNIGTLQGISSGTIIATIPPGTTAGTGYKVRVVASTSQTTSVSSSNITINPLSISSNVISPLKYCPGNNITIPVNTCGIYNSGNTFTAELSDANGNFSFPTTIGSIAGTANCSINAVLPNTLADGSNYKIRVTSSSPATTGTMNLSNIIIRNLINDFSLTSFCQGVTGATIPFTACTSFNSGNVFTAELSDISGNFGTPTVLGSVSATTSGVISVSISSTLALGTGYKLRISSSNPVSVSNESDVAITNCGLSFDGVDDRVIVENSGPQDQINGITGGNKFWTMEAWVRLTTTPKLNSPVIVISTTSASSTSSAFGITNNGTMLSWARNGGAVDQVYSSNTFSSLYDNTCHHIAVTYNDVLHGPLLMFYVDGIQVGSIRATVSIPNSPLILGFDPYKALGMNGNINDVKIWSYARSATEIANNKYTVYSNQTPNLISYYKFQEVSGQTVSDGSFLLRDGYLGNNSNIDSADPIRNVTFCFSTDRKGVSLIPDNGNMDAYIYPNPFSDNVNIAIHDLAIDSCCNLKIVDLNGIVLFDKPLCKDEILSVGNNYPPGVYMLQFYNSKTTIVRRIVKLN